MAIIQYLVKIFYMVFINNFFLKTIRLKKNIKINKIEIKFLKPARYDKFIKIKCEKKRKKIIIFHLVKKIK